MASSHMLGKVYTTDYAEKYNDCENKLKELGEKLNKHLEIIFYLLANKAHSSYYTINDAVKTDNTRILDMMKIYNYSMSPSSDTVHNCSKQVIKWLHDNNYRFNRNVLEEAALTGNLEIMKELYSYGYRFIPEYSTGDTYANAIKSKDKNKDFEETIKWLDSFYEGSIYSLKREYKGNRLINIKMYVAATEINDFELLKDIYEKYSHLESMPNNMLSHAAKIGNLEMMKWLYEKGYKYDVNTFDYACRNNNIDIIKWLLSIGCPFGKYTFSNAMTHMNKDIIILLRNNGCPFSNQVLPINDVSVCERVREDFITFLLDIGYPYSCHDVKAAIYYNKTILESLCKNGYKFTQKDYEDAINKCGKETVEFIEDKMLR